MNTWTAGAGVAAVLIIFSGLCLGLYTLVEWLNKRGKARQRAKLWEEFKEAHAAERENDPAWEEMLVTLTRTNVCKPVIEIRKLEGEAVVTEGTLVNWSFEKGGINFVDDSMMLPRGMEPGAGVVTYELTFGRADEPLVKKVREVKPD